MIQSLPSINGCYRRAHFNEILVLYLSAFGIRLGYYMLDSLIARDGILYVSLFHRFSDVNSQTLMEPDVAYVPPLFLLLIRWLMRFGTTPEKTILIVNLLCGAAIPVFIYSLLLKIRVEKLVAFCAGFVAVFFPFLVRNSTQLLREPLFLFFLFSSVTIAVYASSTSRLQFAASGFFVAFLATCGCFIRAEAGIIACIIAAYWIYKSFCCKKTALGITVWCFGTACMLSLLLLNYPPSMIFYFLTKRIAGVSYYI